MAESGPSYSYTCPQCAGSFSIEIERVPPVQARLPCPGCRQPIDFPSRSEARARARPAQSAPTPAARRSSAPTAAALDETGAGSAESTRFRIERAGFEKDTFDRRSMRNLIRTGDVTDRDLVRVDDSKPVPAGEVPYLKSLFALRKTARVTPPLGCRAHTDRVAFFRCVESARPLCEECAPLKKFGGLVIRVCEHCGGTVADLAHA